MYFSPISRLLNDAASAAGWCFGEAAIANFATAEDLFDVPEGMLHFGTNTSFNFLGFQFFSIQFIPSSKTLSNESGKVFSVLFNTPLLSPKTTGITEDSLFLDREAAYRWAQCHERWQQWCRCGE